MCLSCQSTRPDRRNYCVSHSLRPDYWILRRPSVHGRAGRAGQGRRTPILDAKRHAHQQGQTSRIVHIDIHPDRNSGNELYTRVWDDNFYAVDQGDLPAEWLGDHLGLRARLVKASGSFERRCSQKWLENDNPLLFHDGYPVHWLPIKSVHELSEIAGEEIPWQSFRPQIVVEGMPAQYEHKIFSGVIGETSFVQPKPCDRCPVTLVDQETGKVRQKVEKYGKFGTEPLLTLERYKQWQKAPGKRKVIFGEN